MAAMVLDIIGDLFSGLLTLCICLLKHKLTVVQF
jgi:hypothetical protein